MDGFHLGRRTLIAGGLMLGLVGAACSGLVSDTSDSGSMVLSFGTYTVTVAIPSGTITGGPIVLDDDVTFGAEFLTGEGLPDERVVEPRFRLDAGSHDTTLVKFVRGTAFTGTLQRIAPGTTQIDFSVYDSEIGGYAINATVPITVN